MPWIVPGEPQSPIRINLKVSSPFLVPIAVAAADPEAHSSLVVNQMCSRGALVRAAKIFAGVARIDVSFGTSSPLTLVLAVMETLRDPESVAAFRRVRKWIGRLV